MERTVGLHLSLCAVMSLLLCVLSHKMTVYRLEKCEKSNRIEACVNDSDDCDLQPPTSLQQTLNISCYYEEKRKNQNWFRSFTCEWSEESDGHTEPKVSVIVRSHHTIFSCKTIINRLAFFDVTVRIKNYQTGREIWSRPHTLDARRATKPSPPDLTVLSSSNHSAIVSWTCTNQCSCQLRYKVDNTSTWTQAPDLISGGRSVKLNHTLSDLRPFTDYRAAVRCRESSVFWSQWSADALVKTLERVPSRSPDVCYRLEKADAAESFLLHLMWKDLPLLDAGGRILGYQVSYGPMRTQDRLIKNVRDVTAVLEVNAGNYSVSVRAFNMAGYGPAANISIDTQRQTTVPSVRHLWALSSADGLLVRWETPKDPLSLSLPVSHYVVQWRSEDQQSSSHWRTVDNPNTSTVIQEIDPDESYRISVFPCYHHQCGAPQSLPASLQHGALMEVVKLKVVNVTKTTVTVMWAWRRTQQTQSEPIKVEGYRVMLRRGSERQTLPLWPDQQQHTFVNLQPNTDYSLVLMADDYSRSIIPLTTDFDEVPVVATVTPLLLLAIVVFIISILSRTVYKSYFFPPISSPRGSTTGQWLMDPNPQKLAGKPVLDIYAFEVTDVVEQKSSITVCPNCEPPSEKELHEDASLLSSNQLLIKMDPDYVSEALVFTEPVLPSPQTSYHPVYSVSCSHADQDQDQEVLLPKRNHANVPPQTNSNFPQKEEENGRVSEFSQQRETVVQSPCHEFTANTSRGFAYQPISRVECVVGSSSFKGNINVETNRSLICDDYIANSCFPARTSHEA
ncbi:interleukin-6 receptor subunit beta [Cheilinus undulatus]|uniref:interleukin-6 receptor subunit beta n=1 Tax=Cheilinus undulatus TaxID=241271 RepID=UPI001BD67121|nr:interleukin-6 receptor subunit beta [Cheilinus undulatus]